MKKFLLTIILLILLDCSGKKSYPVRGTIIEMRKETNEFLIQHDEIPNFMMAMTMPFKLSDSLDINRYGVGDSLKFRLEIKEEKDKINKVKINLTYIIMLSYLPLLYLNKLWNSIILEKFKIVKYN